MDGGVIPPPARPPTALFTPSALAGLRAEAGATCEDVARYVLATADFARTDRLWPADFMVFETNPLSVAYGACGTALFLRRVLGAVPAEVAEWLARRPLSMDTYPPGLFVGLAGIACAFNELGMAERACEAMELAYRSPLLYGEPCMFFGTAGWGFASLALFARTRDERYLDGARHAGDHLLRTAAREEGRCSWRNGDGRVHYGFGYGASGIALFLLHLYLATGRDEYRAHAVAGLEFDLANGEEGELGWQWKRHETDTLVFPYWMEGSAGVAAVLERFDRLLEIDRYGTLARRIAEDTYVKYSFVPSLFDGLAGIGELMLDLSRADGGEPWRQRAYDIAETVLWFRIRKPEGTAFPGRWLTRISNDYATGAAGIGLFLARLADPGPRRFVDLDLTGG
jgi:lanthionine synthetase-like protein